MESERTARRLCRLDEAAGWLRPCRGERCAFWEPGGLVPDGHCIFERADLDGDPALATSLRDMRESLEADRRENGARARA